MRHFEHEMTAKTPAREACAPKPERVDDPARGQRVAGQ
jgi:hypothetical protein